MSENRLKELFERYLNETISPDELQLLFNWVRSDYDPETLDLALSGAFTNPEYAVGGALSDKQEVLDALLALISEDELAEPGPGELKGRGVGRQGQPVLKQIGGNAGRQSNVRPFRWKRLATVAAILLLLLGSGTFFYQHRIAKQAEQAAAMTAATKTFDASPGISGATLTLSNGTTISLDAAAHAQLPATQGNAVLSRTDDQLLYTGATGKAAGGSHTMDATGVLYNTLQTARARQYSLVLSDGTKVWLNAGSSIRFPVAFTGKERRVEVTGELYFEVAENRSMPFVVSSGKADVTVMGTSFDVMNYDDEKAMNVTLLEGAVRMDNGTKTMVLKPGFQGEMDHNDGNLSMHPADGDRVIAWTKGLLDLNHADIALLMRQISRWYDVNVVFEGTPPNVHIGGVLHRDVNLSVILEYLSENGVRYKTEGKTVTILRH